MLPVKQLTSVAEMVSVAVLPGASVRVAAEGEIVKACDTGTARVREMVVVAVKAPETPVIVIVAVPAVDAQLDVSVSTLLPAVALGLNAAVIPLGRPDADRVTLPENPPASVTVIVSVALLPGVTVRAVAVGVSVKLPPLDTVRVKVVVAVMVPEVPVMVTVDVPAAAVLLAVNVTTLELADEAGLNDAVTPVGNPVAEKVTAPENEPTSVTAIVSVPLPPFPIERVADEGLRVKLPLAAPQVVPFTANDVGTALVPLHVPLNPKPL